MFRVPVALLHPFDQLRRDAVAFDRQRVIGVALVDVVDESQITRLCPSAAPALSENSPRPRSRMDFHIACIRPTMGVTAGGSDAERSARLQTDRSRARHNRRAFIVLTISSASSGAADAAECAGENARLGRVARRPEEAAAGPMRRARLRQHDLRLDRIAGEERLRHSHQCCRRREQPQTVSVSSARLRRRHLRHFQVVERRAEQQIDVVVRALRAVDDDLLRDDGVLAREAAATAPATGATHRRNARRSSARRIPRTTHTRACCRPRARSGWRRSASLS